MACRAYRPGRRPSRSRVGAAPGADHIAVAPDGLVWTLTDDQLLAIDPAADREVDRLPVPSHVASTAWRPSQPSRTTWSGSQTRTRSCGSGPSIERTGSVPPSTRKTAPDCHEGVEGEPWIEHTAGRCIGGLVTGSHHRHGDRRQMRLIRQSERSPRTSAAQQRRRHPCRPLRQAPTSRLRGPGGAAGRSERRVSDPDLLDGCGTEARRAVSWSTATRAVPTRSVPRSTRTSVEGDVLALGERLVYRPWMCMPAAFEVHATADGTRDRADRRGRRRVLPGTLDYIGESLPAPPAADLGRLRVSGARRQVRHQRRTPSTPSRPMARSGSRWRIVDGSRASMLQAARSGAHRGRRPVGDPGPDVGPCVAAGDAGIWVGQAAKRSVGRIDPESNAIAESIRCRSSPMRWPSMEGRWGDLIPRRSGWSASTWNRARSSVISAWPSQPASRSASTASGWSTTGRHDRADRPRRTRSSRRSAGRARAQRPVRDVRRERGCRRRCGLDGEQRGPLGQPDRS